MIATAAHTQGFSDCLRAYGHDVAGARHEGRLVFLSAEETLALFMVDGHPDQELFRWVIGAIVAQLRERTGGAVRAYGEMVGLLWNAGRSSAAAKLEGFWNELSIENGFQLYCAYQIDVFGSEFQAGVIDEILCAHYSFGDGRPRWRSGRRCQSRDERCPRSQSQGHESLDECRLPSGRIRRALD